MKCDILVVGVGGQGIILTSNVLAYAALNQKLEVKKSETHGMAQRGGSVVSHVRLSDSAIHSPLIPKGEVDILIAYEPVEALRYLDYLKEDSALIVNNNPIKTANYPELDQVIGEIEKHKNSVILDSLAIAERAGNVLTQNVVLVGAASKYLPFTKKVLVDTIKDTVKRAVDENLLAFKLGSEI